VPQFYLSRVSAKLTSVANKYKLAMLLTNEPGVPTGSPPREGLFFLPSMAMTCVAGATPGDSRGISLEGDENARSQAGESV